MQNLITCCALALGSRLPTHMLLPWGTIVGFWGACWAQTEDDEQENWPQLKFPAYLQFSVTPMRQQGRFRARLLGEQAEPDRKLPNAEVEKVFTQQLSKTHYLVMDIARCHRDGGRRAPASCSRHILCSSRKSGLPALVYHCDLLQRLLKAVFGTDDPPLDRRPHEGTLQAAQEKCT